MIMAIIFYITHKFRTVLQVKYSSVLLDAEAEVSDSTQGIPSHHREIQLWGPEIFLYMCMYMVVL